MPEIASRYSRADRAALRELAGEAWEAELSEKLTNLYEDFAQWSDNGMSAFDLVDRIHEFHNGVSRELFKIYTRGDPALNVARAIARGIIAESTLDGKLYEKLRPLIEEFRTDEDDDV